MDCVGFLATGHIFVWQKILKNRSKYEGNIKEQRVVRTQLISAIIIETFRKKKHTNFLYNSIHKFCQSAYTCMSLKVPHVLFCWFCHAAAHIKSLATLNYEKKTLSTNSFVENLTFSSFTILTSKRNASFKYLIFWRSSGDEASGQS